MPPALIDRTIDALIIQVRGLTAMDSAVLVVSIQTAVLEAIGDDCHVSRLLSWVGRVNQELVVLLSLIDIYSATARASVVDVLRWGVVTVNINRRWMRPIHNIVCHRIPAVVKVATTSARTSGQASFRVLWSIWLLVPLVSWTA